MRSGIKKRALVGMQLACLILGNMALTYAGSQNLGQQTCEGNKSINQLIQHLHNDTPEKSCFSALTCDDKIILSQLQHELRNKYNKGDYIDSFLEKLKGPQKLRIKKALIAGSLAIPFVDKDDSIDDKGFEANEVLNNVDHELRHFTFAASKLIEESRRLRDQDSLSKLANLIIYGTKRQENTYLGKLGGYYKESTQDLIKKVRENLPSNLNLSQKDEIIKIFKIYLTDISKKIASEISTAGHSIKVTSENIKNSAKVGLSAAIIGATAGQAGLAMVALNAAGWSGIAVSGVTFAKSANAAIRQNDSQFFCEYAKNGMDDHYFKTTLAGGVLGGAFAATIPALLTSSHVGVKGMGVALTTGVLGVSGKQMVYDRAKQASELEGYAQQAEHEGNDEAASCFRQAKTDKYAEAAIDIASLSAGLLNIKQAHLKPIKVKSNKLSTAQKSAKKLDTEQVSIPKKEPKKVKDISTTKIKKDILTPNEAVELFESTFKSHFGGNKLPGRFLWHGFREISYRLPERPSRNELASFIVKELLSGRYNKNEISTFFDVWKMEREARIQDIEPLEAQVISLFEAGKFPKEVDPSFTIGEKNFQDLLLANFSKNEVNNILRYSGLRNIADDYPHRASLRETVSTITGYFYGPNLKNRSEIIQFFRSWKVKRPRRIAEIEAVEKIVFEELNINS